MLLKEFISKTVSNYLNENDNKISEIRNYLYRYFNLDKIIEPASKPIKSGNVRLYHQTNVKNFDDIKKSQKLKLSKSQGHLSQEPNYVWGVIVKDKDDYGFYGSPKERFTIEYEVPIDDLADKVGFIRRDVEAYEIIAYHDPRIFNVKTIVDDEEYLASIIEHLDYFMTFNDAQPESNEYAYFLIARAIKNMPVKMI